MFVQNNDGNRTQERAWVKDRHSRQVSGDTQRKIGQNQTSANTRGKIKDIWEQSRTCLLPISFLIIQIIHRKKVFDAKIKNRLLLFQLVYLPCDQNNLLDTA